MDHSQKPSWSVDANGLNSVSASAANNLWAVGGYNSRDFGPVKTLTGRWDGRRWSVVRSANAGAEDDRYGVTAISPTDVWAVVTLCLTSLAANGCHPHPLDTQVQTLWLPAIQAQLALDRKNPASALNVLQTGSPIDLGLIQFLNNLSCLNNVYIRGEAYLSARQGSAAAAEFQKIIDHNGLVWNCWTGSLAHLGVARANALQARTSQGADADAARTRALATYKNFLALWKDAERDIPILKEAKAEYAKLQ